MKKLYVIACLLFCMSALASTYGNVRRHSTILQIVAPSWYELDYMEYATDAAAQANYVSSCTNKIWGGNITTNAGRIIHDFTNSSTFILPYEITNVQVYVLGGGGSGGGDNHAYFAAGGGGGGTNFVTLSLAAATYAVTVGAGGLPVHYSNGGNGGASSFSNLVSAGGGGGGSRSDTTSHAGNNGGCGGGSAAGGTAGTGTNGFNGGVGTTGAPYGGGGGGGAGAVGQTSSGNGGNGGSGTNNSPLGASVWLGGGGGGGALSGSAGSGGSGGGGAGTLSGNGSNGTNGLGGGGGGAAREYGDGGSGGSGRVIVSYPIQNLVAYSSTNHTQGSYSLMVYANKGGSSNDTLTRAIAVTNLTAATNIAFDVYQSQIGTNFSLRFANTNGITNSYSVAITSSNTWITNTWDVSGIPATNKNAITNIQVRILNDLTTNTFYIDNLRWQ